MKMLVMLMNKRRQHPLWMIYALALSVKDIIVPLILYFIINDGNASPFGKIVSILLIAYILYKVMTIPFQWKNNTYLFTDSHIEVQTGRLVAHKRYVQLNKIQSYQQHASFFHRLFRLTSLSIILSASSEEAIRLEAIKEEEAKRIISRLQQHTTKKSPELDEAEENKTYYKMSKREIVLISFTSLYILAVFPILLSIYFKMDDIFSLQAYTNYTIGLLKRTPILIAIGVIALLAFGIIAGYFISYIRFGNYTVAADEPHIYIQKGVFSKTSYTIDRHKINAVRIDKPFSKRIFNLATFRFVTLGDLLDETKLETDVLFPYINEKRGKKLLEEMLPSFPFQTEKKSLPKAALFLQLIQPNYTIITITFLTFYFWPEMWMLPAGLFIYLVIYRTIFFTTMKYIQRDHWLEISSGVFTRKTFLTSHEKIDYVRVSQSYLQKKLGLASIVIITRGKPIFEKELKDIRIQDARDIFHWYTNKQYKLQTKEFCSHEKNTSSIDE